MTMKKDSFREAFIRLVAENDCSIAEIARRTRISKYLLNALHQRKTEVPNVHDAVILARFFGTTVEEMVGGDAVVDNSRRHETVSIESEIALRRSIEEENEELLNEIQQLKDQLKHQRALLVHCWDQDK
jgi:transcriptional regulator with XRE-family HTH domain